MQDIKLVALDIDGTILRYENGHFSISNGVKAIIDELQQQGIKVMIATGRNYSATHMYLTHLNLHHMHHVLCSGAVTRSPNGSFINVNYIPQEDYQIIVTELMKRDVPFAVIQEEYVYSNQRAEDLNLQATEGYHLVSEKQLIALSHVTNLWVGPHPVSQLQGWLETFNLTLLVHNDNHLELLAKNLGKGLAIAEVAKHYGIDLSHVMAIGDGGNDVQMLEMAGLGVAMGNAPEWVKESANTVTDSIEDDGVVSAIRRYILSDE